MRILFTGGGTGGHVFPIVAVVREIRKLWPNEKFKFFYLGPKDDFSSIILSQEGIKIGWTMAGKIRRYVGYASVLQNALDLAVKFPLGLLQAFVNVFFIGPDVIFSKGGFGSFPTVVIGWIFRVPIFMHESDVAPGLANRILSRFAKKIFVSFRQTEYFSVDKTLITGNPIRTELLEGSKEKAKELFKLTGEKPVLVVLGGSQGAQRINDVIIEILPELLQIFEVVHQCGEKNFKETKGEANVMMKEDLKKYYHLVSFVQEPELKELLAGADIILSRAGSGSIFEIALLGKPSILVPLAESAQDHQKKNAYSFAQNGTAIVFEEENLTPHFLMEKLKYLLLHPEELASMAQKAKAFAKPDAQLKIAEYILEGKW